MDIDSTLKLTTPVAVPAPSVSTVSSSAASASVEPSVTTPQVVQQEAPVAKETQDVVEALRDAVVKMNEYVQSEQRTIHFSVDEDSGKDVVTVLDRVTEEVIRQMPSEEALVFARRLAEQSGEKLSLFSDLA